MGKQVALIAAYDASGKLLLGKRKDNGKWTLPGGGIEPGEPPKVAAARELLEETGLHAQNLEPKNTQHLTNGVTIYYFRALVEGVPTSAKDPDEECEYWEFVDVGQGLPWDKYDNLHGPKAADDNVVKQTYDVAKSEALEKMAIASIPRGVKQDSLHYDYNHVLTPEQKAAGYSLRVEEDPGDSIEAHVIHGGRPVGHAFGRFWGGEGDKPKAISPHSELGRDHRRQGLGTAMYEALYAHALSRGIKRVVGHHHTEAAAAVHRALARKHGLDYKPQAPAESFPNYEHGRYGYIIKNEDPAFAADASASLQYPTVIVIRHGQTDFNSNGKEDEGERLRGWKDIPLNDRGRDQAREAAKELAQVPVSKMYVSDLCRTVETASIVGRYHPDAVTVTTAALRPWDMGDLTGHPIREVIPVMLDYINRENERMAGSCESFLEFQHRILSEFKLVMDECRKNSDMAYVIVTHSRGTRMMKGWVDAGASDINVLDKEPLLRKQDTVDTGRYMVVQFRDGHWVQQEDNYPFVANMIKAETEIDRMLKNPDRRERTLAMRMDGVEPRHVANALMDPDPALVHAAMDHGHVTPELLMGVCRTPTLSDGSSAQGRHRILLQFHGDRFTLPHLRALLNTHKNPDPYLLEAIMKAPACSDPEFAGNVFKRLEAVRPMAKAVDPEAFKGMVKGLSATGPDVVDHTVQLNQHPPEHGHLAEAYHQHVLSHPEPRKPLKGQGELHRGVSKKLIFSTPTAKFMVKPYHENVGRWRRQRAEIFPILGWSEMASQGLFHAAGLGHLHQKVHLIEHDMGTNKAKEPALAIHVEPGFKQAAAAPRHWMTPRSGEELRKLVMMDFLTNNMDRHGGNLLVNPEGHLLAIDNARLFQYTTNPYYFSRGLTLAALKKRQYLSDSFKHYHYGSAAQAMEPFRDPELNTNHERDLGAMERYKPIFEWWAGVSKPVREEMDKQLQAIKDPALRAHIRRNFEARADWLDERADFGLDNYGLDWHSDETVPQYRFGEMTTAEKEARMKAIAVARGEKEDRERRAREGKAV